MANAKKKPAAKKPAAKKQDEPEVQVNRTVNETTESQDKSEQKASTEKSEQTADVPQYQPRHLPLENAGFDHQAAEDRRQADLAEARNEHNRRTGDASRS